MSSYRDRQKSSIINIRIFHNWVKTRLIKEAVDYLRKEYNITKPTLFDLAVGKGGDMYKWYKNNILEAVGIDIDEKSITGEKGAVERYESMKNKLRSYMKKIPKYDFYIYDLSDKDNILHITHLIKTTKFNIVSCQFAIHYFFRDEESLDALMQIVSNHIADKGIFIGTTMDGNKVVEAFMNGDIIEKEIYTLDNQTNIQDTYTPYGNKYIVSLGKNQKGEEHYFSDKSSTEYMVDIEELKRVAEKYKLRFIGTTEFEKWYEIYLNTKPKYKLSDEEKEFSFLNISFVFVRL